MVKTEAQVIMVVSPPESSSQYQIPPDVLSKLRQTPWCATILDDPSFLPLRSHSRNPPPHRVGRYTLMSQTLSTPETVPIWQAFYRPSSNPDPGPNDIGEVRVLIVLGSGMDGHLHTLHGGVAPALLDEAMGNVAAIHTAGKTIYTAFLHINYKKPLPTPNVVMIKAKLDPKSRGRKSYISASIEDGNGTIFNTAEALFLQVERKPRPKI